MTERRPSAMPLFKNSRRPASVNVCSFIAYHPRQVIPVRSRRKRCCHKRCLTFIQLFRATTGSSSTPVTLDGHSSPCKAPGSGYDRHYLRLLFR
jgi:hypothetical protein